MKNISKINNPINIKLLLLSIWFNLHKRRKLQIIFALLIMILSSFAELFSVVSTLPFLYIVTSEPEKILDNNSISFFANLFGYTEANELLLPITILFVACAVLSGLFKISNVWIQVKLANVVGSDFSSASYLSILNKSYAYHTNHNSSTFITIITRYLDDLIAVVNLSLDLITNVLIFIVILSGLLIINFSVSLSIMLFFLLIYLLLSNNTKLILQRNSFKIADLKQQQLKNIREGIGSIREVILERLQTYYLSSYKKIDYSMRAKVAESQFISQFPRPAIETLGIALLAILAYILSISSIDSATIVPILGAIAIGLQKILPSLQRIYSCWAGISTSSSAAMSVVNAVQSVRDYQSIPKRIDNFIPMESIEFKDISFKYENKDVYSIENLNIRITKGERIIVVGGTGSGKSTFLDLLMGLISPSNGKILINGNDLYSSDILDRWRINISHVPQSIYLSDNTILENIALGVPRDKINKCKVKEVAKVSCIDSFIESLPCKYDTFTGERGVSLSGGQLQRIGIARALYKCSNLLILDEATSALDTKTEKKVMEGIRTFRPELTTISVTHRISSISKEDRIVEFL